MAAPGSFPPALTGLCIARQNNRASPSSAALRPFRSAPGAGPVRPPSFVAMKAAAVAVDPTREHPMSTDHDDTGFEPEHASYPTAQIGRANVRTPVTNATLICPFHLIKTRTNP